MKIKTIAVNAIVAALYVAITFVIQPFAFLVFQFRIPEMFNHLVVFNKKFFFGIVIGVFLANLFFSPIRAYDLFYGVGQSVIALTLTIILSLFIKKNIIRMILNTVIFSFTMFIIAYELNLAFGYPFLETWAYSALFEFIVMFVGMPVMYMINKRVDFNRLINR